MTNAAGLSQNDTLIARIRPVRPIYVESSLAAAIEALKDSNCDAVPIVSGSQLVGVLWGRDIRKAMLRQDAPDSPIASAIDRESRALLPNDTSAQAQRLLVATGMPSLPVAGEDGRYYGMISTLDLYAVPEVQVRPPHIGGMATPFGVFLTNGEISGGAGPVALTLTGAMMFGMLSAGIVFTVFLLERWSLVLGGDVYRYGLYFLPSIIFFALLRALPIAGTHGAEHMVVHAIERREPLTLEAVRRMPRVHPRCGTNIAVGAMLFTTLSQYLWEYFGPLGPLFALATTMILWRPLGSLFQQYVTTKAPTNSQINGAIQAANELLQRYKKSSRLAPSPLRRLVMSGLPYVLLGSLLAYFTLAVAAWAFHIDPARLGL